MFNFRFFGQLFALSSVGVCSFLNASPAITNDNIARNEKIEQQASVILALDDTEKLRLQHKADVKLEGIKPRRLGEGKTSFLDPNIQYYNMHLLKLKSLPSKAQQIEIHVKDNNIQRLLKQQLNDAIEIYQIVGQLLRSGKVDSVGLFAPSTLPAIQITIAEMNLATTPREQLAANEVCLTIAQQWERDNQALEQAGVGLRSDILKASYYRQYCEIQTIKLLKKRSNPSISREAQLQQQSSTELNEIKPIAISKEPPIEALPIENRERAQQYRRKVNQIINPLIGYYNANVRLLKLIPSRQALEIRKEGSDLQKLQNQQLGVALELNRLQALRLIAGLIDSDTNFNGAISNPTAELALLAIQIALVQMNLATNLDARAVANEVGLKIAQSWEKNAVSTEKTVLRKNVVVLTARYWRRHFEIQKLQTEFNSRS